MILNISLVCVVQQHFWRVNINYKLTHLILEAAFDGSEERPETGKKIMANLLQYPLSLTTLGSPQVVSYCTPDTCSNRGVCQDAWISSACDCDLTSFTGPTCTDGRISFMSKSTNQLPRDPSQLFLSVLSFDFNFERPLNLAFIFFK